MNIKRLLLAIPVIFVGIFVTDFLIHGVWLKGDYAASASLWRPEAEMQKYFGWVLLGELLAAVTACVLWAKGFADKGCALGAGLFGLCLGLFSQATTLVTYAVQPLPASLVTKWFVAGAGQGVLMGLLLYVVYKPKPGVTGKCG